MPDDRAAPPSFVPGPLDQLVPGLRAKTDKLPARVVHPRTTWTTLPDGTRALVMASFQAPNSAAQLHAALKPMLEAALLSELCRPREQLLADDRTPSHVLLYAFEDLPFDPAPALLAFGLEAAPLDAPDTGRALALARQEARLVETDRREPQQAFSARIQRGAHPLRAIVRQALLETGKLGAWGAQPGLWARTAADVLAPHGLRIEATPQGVDTLESLCSCDAIGAIRWIDPPLFQALCDLLAVMAARRPNTTVEWGLCEPDDSGLPPPPVIRLSSAGESWHVPLGEHVLGWCVMPKRHGEIIPSLGSWAEHEFR